MKKNLRKITHLRIPNRFSHLVVQARDGVNLEQLKTKRERGGNLFVTGVNSYHVGRYQIFRELISRSDGTPERARRTLFD
jgi:hypothetical protein